MLVKGIVTALSTCDFEAVQLLLKCTVITCFPVLVCIEDVGNSH